jgi:hypothetical protein
MVSYEYVVYELRGDRRCELFRHQSLRECILFITTTVNNGTNFDYLSVTKERVYIRRIPVI